MSRVCFELDDWGHGIPPSLQLMEAKKAKPKLKVTIFAIPTLIDDYDRDFFKRNAGWIEVAVHGFYHSSRECFDWSIDEAQEKIIEGCRLLNLLPGVSGFKPPSWVANGQTYSVIEDMGMWCADHPGQSNEWLKKSPKLDRYVVGMDPDLKSVHGHTWEISDNGPSVWVDQIKDLPDDSEFLFASECLDVLEVDEIQEFENSWSSKETGYGNPSATFLLGGLIEYFQPDGSKVIDIGGNDGYAAFIAKEKGYEVDVLDVSPTRCAYARHRFELTAFCANAEDMPFEDNEYDWGFCAHTLEHIKHLDKALAEIKRVCKKGCLYVIPLQSREQFINDLAHNQWMDKDQWVEKLGAKELVSSEGELVCLAKF